MASMASEEAIRVDEPWVSIPELANRIRTNRRTLYRWIREGKLSLREDSTPSEFRFAPEEADRIVGLWDPARGRLRQEP